MQVPPERILTEQRLNHLGSIMADCIKELYKDSLPNATFTVYMKNPKSDDQGNESSAFIYVVSDDSVDGETLQNYIDRYDKPLRQCFLDKLSSKDNKDLDRNWVGYLGKVLSLKEEQPTKSNELIEDFSFDESKWIEIVKFAQRDNWFSKFEITSGQVTLTVIQLTAPQIWDILKPHLSEAIKSGNKHLTDLIEQIQDLPVEEILDKLEEIINILNVPFL